MNADSTSSTSPSARAGFGGAGSTAQLVLAICGPIAAVLACWGRVTEFVFIAAVLVPTPVLLGLLAVRFHSTPASADLPAPASPVLRMWLARLRFAVVSALFAAWLLVAIAVGLASAGGAVWL